MFNFRTVAGNATLSLHAVGAFDLITRLNRPRPGLGRAWEVPDYQHFPQPRLRPGVPT